MKISIMTEKKFVNIGFQLLKKKKSKHKYKNRKTQIKKESYKKKKNNLLEKCILSKF